MSEGSEPRKEETSSPDVACIPESMLTAEGHTHLLEHHATLAWPARVLTTCLCSQKHIGGYWLIGAIIKCQCTSLFSGSGCSEVEEPVRGPGKVDFLCMSALHRRKAADLHVYRRLGVQTRPGRWVQGGCSALSGIAYSLMLVRRSHDFSPAQEKLKTGWRSRRRHTGISSMMLFSVCPA